MYNSAWVIDHLPGGKKHNPDDPLIIAPKVLLKVDKAAASIDLRLGCWLVTPRHARMTHLRVGAKEFQNQLTKTHYLPFGCSYVLHPGSLALGGTLEWVRLPRNVGAYVIGRSSWGRRGLVIATAAGVHPGFTGCLTLELTNLGQVPIEIRPGMRICQLFIHEVKGHRSTDVDRSQFIGQRKPSLGSVTPDETAYRMCLALGGPHGTKQFRVLTGPYSEWNIAEKKADEIEKMGFDCRVEARSNSDNEPEFLIEVGAYDSEADADAVRAELKKQDFEVIDDGI